MKMMNKLQNYKITKLMVKRSYELFSMKVCAQMKDDNDTR